MTGAEQVSRMKWARNAKTGIRVANLRTPSRRFRPGRRQVLQIILLLCLFMASSIGYVWLNFKGTRMGYDLSELKKEEMRLREINRKLKLELATLRSPQYLERTAIEKLRMGHPSPERIIDLP